MLGAKQIAEEISGFAADMASSAERRWNYAATVSHVGEGDGAVFVPKAMPPLARFLGATADANHLGPKLQRIREFGFDGAVEKYRQHSSYWVSHHPYPVGPIEPWQIGHVYFARVKSFPHVAKVGFSRRVAERIADVESKSKCRLTIESLWVGTLADEKYWHQNWRALHIAGEWFYWPKSTDRTLPAFLQAEAVAA